MRASAKSRHRVEVSSETVQEQRQRVFIAKNRRFQKKENVHFVFKFKVVDNTQGFVQKLLAIV